MRTGRWSPGARYTALFLVALVLGGTFRFYRLDWGRPQVFHPDEARVSYAIGDIDRQAAALRSKLARGERVSFRQRIEAYNPHFFAYGSLPLYVTRSLHDALSTAGVYCSRVLQAAGLKRIRLSPPDLFVVGRGISAFFDTLTILMVFLIGSRLFSRRAGALASLFFAFTVFHIQLAHFITVDVTLASLIAVTIYFCARVMEEGRLRHYLLTGLCAGLAVATKFTALPILIPLLTAHLAFCWRERRFTSLAQWGKLIIGLAALAAFFTAGEPFFLLDHREFVRQIREQRDMVQGRWSPPWTYQYEHTVRGLYQLKNLVAYCMGAPLGILLIAGIGYLLVRIFRKPDRGTLLLLAWLIPVAGATVSFKIKFIRYWAPLIPFLCVLGAQGICLLYERARERGFGVAVRLAVYATVAFSLFYSLSYMNVYRHEDSRVQASRWMYKNIPKGSRILGETWEFAGLPVGTAEGNQSSLNYTVRQLDIYKPDDRNKARYLAGEIAKADCIAIPTKRMYGSILRIPERYPFTANYYRLLFGERLGYKLVRSTTSHPRLFGVSFNDDRADESFTVYDHPKVLIFKKVTDYSADYLQRLIAAEPKIDYWPVLADALGADEFNRPERAAARVSPSLDGFVPRERSGAVAVIVWLAMVELMGLAALPLTVAFFSRFRDGGYAFAKIMAIAIAGYVVWCLASLGVAPFSRGLILGGVGAVFLLSCHRASRGYGWGRIFRSQGRTAIVSELVFLGSFLVFLVFRLYNPDIFWSESSMDFSFINSILRSRSFPPIDPWASGIYLNYYYYGHYLVAMLTTLSGIPSPISYNLAFCLIPALVISAACSIVYTLTGRVRYGLLAGLFAGMMGNLDGFFLLVDTCPWRDAFYRFLHLAMPTHRESVFRFFRCAHEVIPFSVHEYPFWSFIFMDLHAHVVAMPFALALIALALNLLLAPRGARRLFGEGLFGAGNFLVAAVILGMMVPMNTWDFPTYLFLIALALLARELFLAGPARHRVPVRSNSIWWSCTAGGRILHALLGLVFLEGPVGSVIKSSARTACVSGALAIIALGAYSPFFQFFGRQGMGIGWVGGLTTPLGSILRFFGFFLFVIASWIWIELVICPRGGRGVWKGLIFAALLLCAAAAPWRAAGIWFPRDYATLSLAIALLLGGLLAVKRHRGDPAGLYALLLVVYGMAIIAFCELVHIRDFLQGGEWKRMNTIFKFYMPVWFFFSIAGAFCLSRMFRHRAHGLFAMAGRGIWYAVFFCLLAASLVFTVMGPRARAIDNDTYSRAGMRAQTGIRGVLFPKVLAQPTLDGLAYMKSRTPDEYKAILWLNQRITGQPVLAEATLEDYRYEYARISSNTGLPAVLGWWSHVDQRGYAYRDIRRNDIIKFYKSGDPLELAATIAKYDIGYVYVGPTERRSYTPGQVAKFDVLDALFTPVFKSGDVTIYQTSYAGPVSEKGEAAQAPQAPPGATAVPTAPPRVGMLEGGEGAGPGEYNEPRGIAMDASGNVYIADFRNYRIQKFDQTGLFIAAWGEEGDYPGQFKDPCGVASGGGGRVYVADTFNNRVQVFDGKGKYLSHFEGGFFAPRGLAVDGKGRVWVADTGNGKIKIFSSDGKVLNSIGKKGKGPGEFDNPNSIAMGLKGRVYVADAGNRRVQILDREGNYVSEFPVDGWQGGVFNEPYLDVDPKGNIYLTDPLGHRALRYSADGKLTGVLKPGGDRQLQFPMGIAVDKTGDAVYIVDCRNHRIRKFSKGEFK